MSRRGKLGVVGALALGYVGIYLCRKNLSVAIPLLREAFDADRQAVGRIASVSTLAYALGKVFLGPVVDRLGGRVGFLGSMALVAVLGAAGAFAPGLAVLTLLYSANRFAGAAGWPSMMKLVPTWFGAAHTATVAAVLSLSYVLGGVAATVFASRIVDAGGGWRAVMGIPSLALALILVVCVFVVRAGPLGATEGGGRGGVAWADVASLLRRRRFLIVCGLSFALTLMREAFNTWTVDFLATSNPGGTLAGAALGSTAFDIAGAASILAMGVGWDRTPPAYRRWLLAGILGALAVLLAVLPTVAMGNPVAGAFLVGAVGLLVYGPYSLLAGAFAVQSGGPRLAATASGVIDAIGYGAGVLAGEALGRVVDAGGYTLGFRCLAAIVLAGTVLALALPPDQEDLR